MDIGFIIIIWDTDFREEKSFRNLMNPVTTRHTADSVSYILSDELNKKIFLIWRKQWHNKLFTEEIQIICVRFQGGKSTF